MHASLGAHLGIAYWQWETGPLRYLNDFLSFAFVAKQHQFDIITPLAYLLVYLPAIQGPLSDSAGLTDWHRLRPIMSWGYELSYDQEIDQYNNEVQRGLHDGDPDTS